MRWRRILLGLAVCAALVIIVLAFIPREPRYKGRALSEWIRDSAPRHSPEPETTRAIEAVRHIGTNGLPWLVQWLRDREPPPWKRKLLALADKLPLWLQNRVVPFFFADRSYQVRRRIALDGFVILGPQASPAVPELLKIGDAWSASALDSIGLASLAPTLNVLTNRDHPTALRAAAATRLGFMDEKFALTNAVQILVRCVRDTEPQVAKESAKTLVKLGVEPDLTVTFFANLLLHGDVLSRYEAAENLRVLREKARPAVPALVQALNDPDWYVRRGATITLYRVDPDALEKAVPGIIAAIHNSNQLGD
jgi:HEAT repeat protein